MPTDPRKEPSPKAKPGQSPPKPVWRGPLLVQFTPPLTFGVVAAMVAFILVRGGEVMWGSSDLTLLAIPFLGPLLLSGALTYEGSNAVTAAGVWFAIAFFTRLFAKRDLIALCVLAAFFATGLCWGIVATTP
jgi:hypothetical protein